MGTLQVETSNRTTIANHRDSKERGLVNGEDDDESPIEEVRLTVSNSDDPTLPVWTFRMWFLGLLSCGLLSFLNQFFSYRTEPLVITQITVLVSTLPIGHFLAATLPTTKFRIPGFGSRLFSLNPGPFNLKEHVLISIFANAGSAFGNGSAYAVGIVTIIKAFYRRKISFLAGWLLIITTQVSLSLSLCTHRHLKHFKSVFCWKKTVFLFKLDHYKVKNVHLELNHPVDRISYILSSQFFRLNWFEMSDFQNSR